MTPTAPTGLPLLLPWPSCLWSFYRSLISPFKTEVRSHPRGSASPSSGSHLTWERSKPCRSPSPSDPPPPSLLLLHWQQQPPVMPLDLPTTAGPRALRLLFPAWTAFFPRSLQSLLRPLLQCAPIRKASPDHLPSNAPTRRQWVVHSLLTTPCGSNSNRFCFLLVSPEVAQHLPVIRGSVNIWCLCEQSQPHLAQEETGAQDNAKTVSSLTQLCGAKPGFQSLL